jgi:hypothetical protein
MNQAPQDNQNLKLANHLKLIEDLWQKLYYVKWNPKSFAMLARLAQDMAQNAQREATMSGCSNWSRNLSSMSNIAPPPADCRGEADRQRLTAHIDALRFILATAVRRVWLMNPVPAPCWRHNPKFS